MYWIFSPTKKFSKTSTTADTKWLKTNNLQKTKGTPAMGIPFMKILPVNADFYWSVPSWAALIMSSLAVM